jgi:hypothetical protein
MLQCFAQAKLGCKCFSVSAMRGATRRHWADASSETRASGAVGRPEAKTTPRLMHPDDSGLALSAALRTAP